MKRLAFLLLCLVAPVLAFPAAADYDPLKLPAADASAALAAPADLTVRDARRGRDIPVRVFLPAQKGPAPVVLFSHGLGGSRENSPYLGRHWAGRGYAVVFMQHAGSDEAVWKDKSALERGIALKQAASLPNLLLRVADVPAVLDQLALWNTDEKSPLRGRLDLARVGMSGHSFGAVTTQALSGQTIPGGQARFTDARIRAALVMSPSVPAAGSADRAFGSVKLPWLLMTGTRDVARFGTTALGATDAVARLAVYTALPAGDKYELVLNGAEHSAFGERALPGDTGQRNPNHHRAILGLSTAFWDAFLKGDPAAKTWLNCDGPRALLEKDDRWQRK